jgi:acetoacetyl-CoA synthetase
MKVKAYDETGSPVVDQQAELVCEAPSPSMPLYFWNDPEGKRYKAAYFDVYPNVWRHGDWIIIHGDTHGDWIIIHGDTSGITFLGRSDFTLKPSGVRIGPAEIYNVVERFEEIADSMVVGQEWKGDQRIILFVKLAPGFQLTENSKSKIRRALRADASPRHVPALIIEAPGIPYTFNMKKVESAASNLINGRPVTNRDALINPESLEFYEKMLPKLRKDD